MLGVFCSKMPIHTNEINKRLFEYKWIFLFVAQLTRSMGVLGETLLTASPRALLKSGRSRVRACVQRWMMLVLHMMKA